MVYTKKFSEFTTADLAQTDNELVGLSNGANARSPKIVVWTTATRPAPPPTGVLGFNSNLQQYEFYDGVQWQAIASGGSGTVTQINTGTGLTGGPITDTGTISFAPIAANSLWANVTGASAVPTEIPTSTFLFTANNLSDVPNKSTARTNLGLAIGTNVQAWSAILDQISAGTWPGATSITTLGTIAFGTWHSVAIELAYGGTNANLTADNGGIVYSTATALAILASTNAANRVLLSGNASAPSWSTATYPATTTANQILYSSSNNTISEISTAINSVLATNGLGVPAFTATLPSAVQSNITAVGTIASGTWNGSTIDVSHGGTSATSFTAYSVICGGTTSTGALQSVASVGLAGQVLTSSGPGSLPTWQNSAGSGTVNSGTANQLAYYATTGNAVSGLTSANNGTLVTSNTGVPSILAGPGTTGNIFQSNAAAAPSWSTATYPSTTTINQLLYSSAANVISGLATVNSAGLLTNGSGVPGWVAATGTGAPVLANSPTLTGTPVIPSPFTLGATSVTSTGTQLNLLNALTAVPFDKMAIQKFTSSGTYTPTTGMVYALGFCIGSGGGGGGVAQSSGAASGGGGGAGSLSITLLTAASVGASQTVTIGAAGTGGAAGTNNGNPGGDVSIGTLCIGKGGSGGAGAAANTPANGGAGGVAGTGDITTIGNAGFSGGGASISTASIPRGWGGSSFFGGKPVSTGYVTTNGANANLYGAGGEGGYNYNNSPGGAAGGDGSKGIAFIIEFLSA